MRDGDAPTVEPRQAPPSWAEVEALARAFVAAPSEAARAPLREALLALRDAGAAATFEEAPSRTLARAGLKALVAMEAAGAGFPIKAAGLRREARLMLKRCGGAEPAARRAVTALAKAIPR